MSPNPNPYNLPERLELLRKAKSGDSLATRRFLEMNQGLFEMYINQYRRYVASHEVDDLRQEGMRGLLEGIAAFDPEKLSGKPESYVFGWVRARVARFSRDRGQGALSKTETYLEDIGEQAAEDLGGVTSDEPEIDFEGVEKAVTAGLTEQERFVYKERMSADCPKKLRELSEMMGICTERVRMIEEKARRKMRVAWERLEGSR
jgi:RNA polymerase sigma factor (sigma-70 family)